MILKYENKNDTSAIYIYLYLTAQLYLVKSSDIDMCMYNDLLFINQSDPWANSIKPNY